MQAENRKITRFPCAIAVTGSRRSAVLGEITDISLDGMFITTTAPLAEGAVLPTVFRLGEAGPEIRPEAEVVRRNSQGMGLKFLAMSPQDSRRLRRFVAEVSSVVGSRRMAQDHLQDADGRTTAAIDDIDKVRQLLVDSVGSTAFTVIPGQRDVRLAAELVRVSGANLHFQLAPKAEADIVVGEDVFVLYTRNFVSYSFPARVGTSAAGAFTCALPERMHFSERRSARQARASVPGSAISLSLPWAAGLEARRRWPIQEVSEGGLSFRARPDDAHFWPGTQLPSASIEGIDGKDVIEKPIVKHLTAMRDADGTAWVKVGLAFNVERQSAAVNDAQLDVPAAATSAGLAGRVATWGRDLATRASFLYHTRLRRAAAGDEAQPFTVVKFLNRAGHPLVGLLSRSYSENRRVRAPIVIVTPGVGARKETLTALATVLVDNFRRQHRDLAVLRFDGSNNIGESYKDPGCEGEGRSNVNYTISGGVDDLLGAVAWAKDNRYVDPTDIIVISVSFSSLAVRHALTLPETRDIRRWIVFMGAGDAQNAIVNITGNFDGYDAYVKGRHIGHIALLGCLIDGDHFCADAHRLRIATLEDARREMAQISADVTWVVGKHDAFMSPERVRDVMDVKAPGKREVVQVDAGHVPKTSDEALAEFMLLTRYVWRHLYGRDLLPILPSKGYIAAVSDAEWRRVRHAELEHSESWWKEYLVGDGGLGFDVWALTPDYRQLMADQARVADVAGKRALDLGAGTGNMSRAMATQRPASLTAIDLVPEALERARQKVQDILPLETVTASIDGHPRLAMVQFLNGELPSLHALAARLPASHQGALEAIASSGSARAHAVLRGANLDVEAALRAAGISRGHHTHVRDLQVLARFCRKRLSLESAVSAATPAVAEIMRSPAGLPFADASFDVVVSSLVLSYMAHPSEALAEVRRVLAPGGRFVVSTMLPDFDTSATYMTCIRDVEAMAEGATVEGFDRETLLQALRKLQNNGANLLRLEEEGVFRFWTGPELVELVTEAGFENASYLDSSGTPAQATIVTCQSP